jgi:hypothetical protein
MVFYRTFQDDTSDHFGAIVETSEVKKRQLEYMSVMPVALDK